MNAGSLPLTFYPRLNRPEFISTSPIRGFGAMFQTVNVTNLLPPLSAVVVIPNVLACPGIEHGFGTLFAIYFPNLYRDGFTIVPEFLGTLSPIVVKGNIHTIFFTHDVLALVAHLISTPKGVRTVP